MTVFIAALWRILVLQAQVSSLPRSRALLVLALVFNIGLSTVLYSLTPTEFATPPALLIVYSLFTLALYALILRLRGFANRIEQVLTAIIGVDALLTFGIVVILVVVGVIPDVILLFVLLWTVVVRGRIIADGMNWPWLAGSALEIALLDVSFRVFAASAAKPEISSNASAALVASGLG